MLRHGPERKSTAARCRQKKLAGAVGSCTIPFISPDGYTALLTTSALAVNIALTPKSTFDSLDTRAMEVVDPP